MSSSKNGPSRPAPPPPNGAAPKATNSYSRFIPREELSSFAAWNPEALNGAEAADKGVQRPAPPEPPQPSHAEELAEATRAARNAGYQDGYRDGLVALEGFKQSYATQVTAQLAAVTQSYMAQLDGLQQQMARALAVSATHLARQMVRSEIEQRPELVVTVAQEAVDTLLLSARHITLRVNPEDAALVAQGTAEVLAARGARIVSDAAVARGGCLVESDIGVIDASVESRWRRAAASIGCDEAWIEAPAPEGAEDTTA
ncbi:MAG: FliH/SctL family protein [Rhizobacter sp.]|jgi:flagellar assembly protein FliH